MLVQPGGGEPLRCIRQDEGEYLQAEDETRYAIDDGIILFLDDDALSGNNLKYQRMYDRFAPLYDTVTRTYARMRGGNERSRVMQYLSGLEVRDGSRVIEISVGTGRNIKYLNPNAQYYGVDISLNMLKRCARQMKRCGRDITLIQAEAEHLPIRDESFDVVYSAGGFNFFNDREQAVREMLRIAKPGTLLMISDETEKVRQAYDNKPLAGKYYAQDRIVSPAGLAAKYGKEVAYREVCGGGLYALTFRKT